MPMRAPKYRRTAATMLRTMRMKMRISKSRAKRFTGVTEVTALPTECECAEVGVVIVLMSVGKPKASKWASQCSGEREKKRRLSADRCNIYHGWRGWLAGSAPSTAILPAPVSAAHSS